MNNSGKNFKIYIDFDGTISTRDIGEHLFLEFGDPDKCRDIIASWLNGDLNSKEVWISLCGTVSNFDKERFDEFINTFTIDPYFHDFIEFCKTYKFETIVLSDGLDYYINKFSEKENLQDLTIYCNKLSFDDNNNLIPLFPHTDEECSKCANCKRNHILNSSSEEDITVYIGDGWSDTCAAEHCDIIFAKRSLLKYCENNGLPYHSFKTFYDVKKIMEKVISKKKIKKRHRALLKRKEAYMQG